MRRHMLKLLALLTVLAVAPATASQRTTGVSAVRHNGCPHRRAAEARAAAIFAHLSQARKAPMRVTLIDRVTKVDSLAEFGGGSKLMMP
jgi:hypothetical protein